MFRFCALCLRSLHCLASSSFISSPLFLFFFLCALACKYKGTINRSASAFLSVTCDRSHSLSLSLSVHLNMHLSCSCCSCRTRETSACSSKWCISCVSRDQRHILHRCTVKSSRCFFSSFILLVTYAILFVFSLHWCSVSAQQNILPRLPFNVPDDVVVVNAANTPAQGESENMIIVTQGSGDQQSFLLILPPSMSRLAASRRINPMVLRLR